MPPRKSLSAPHPEGAIDSWRSAFAEQARSDYEMFLSLQKPSGNVPLCHQLHYLQMATEKLAKAFMAGPDRPGDRPPSIHTAFTKFVQMAKSKQEVRAACGFDSQQFYVQYLASLAPMAREVERLAPNVGGSDSPNTEYPWLQHGWIFSPLIHPFSSIGQEQPAFRKLLRFIEACLKLV